MDTQTIIESFSYVGIFLLMTANGVSNIPSSQLLYILTGYFISTGMLQYIPTIIAGSLGNTLGNMITFLLVKKYGEKAAQKILMLNDDSFQKVHTTLHTTLREKGLWYIFLGKITPSIKAFIPVIAGLAHTNTQKTLYIFFAASTVWALIINSIGYFFGKNVTPTGFTIVSLGVGVTILLFFYRSISKSVKIKSDTP